VRFGGKKSVTIPAGQEIFSDGTMLSWVKVPMIPVSKGATWLSATQSKATAAR
jgi:hypothetical protein